MVAIVLPFLFLRSQFQLEENGELVVGVAPQALLAAGKLHQGLTENAGFLFESLKTDSALGYRLTERVGNRLLRSHVMYITYRRSSRQPDSLLALDRGRRR